MNTPSFLTFIFLALGFGIALPLLANVLINKFEAKANKKESRGSSSSFDSSSVNANYFNTDSCTSSSSDGGCGGGGD